MDKNEIALLNLMLIAMQHQTVLRKLASPSLPSLGESELNDLLSKTDSYIQKTIEVLLPEVKTNG